MKRCVVGFLLLGALALPTVVWAHGGRTNARGCHNDRKHGGYHCHGGATATPIVPIRPRRPVSPPAKVSPRSSGLPCPSAFPDSMTTEEKLTELDQCYGDALIRLEEYQRRRAELLREQRQAPTSVPAVAEKEPPLASSLEKQLRELKRQRENREITPEEYYEKRGELLSEGE